MRWTTIRRKIETWNFSLRKERLYPTLGTPTFKACTCETIPKKIWLWKPMELASTRPTGLWRTEKELFLGPHTTYSPQGSAQKQPFAKHSDFLWKRHVLFMDLSYRKTCICAWNKLMLGAQLLQPCLTLCNPMDYSLPVSSAHGIFFQAIMLEWGAISSSKRSSRPRN